MQIPRPCPVAAPYNAIGAFFPAFDCPCWPLLLPDFIAAEQFRLKPFDNAENALGDRN
jgi:hypothetical protein